MKQEIDFMDRFTRHVFDVMMPAMEEMKKYLDSRGINSTIYPHTEPVVGENKKTVITLIFDIKLYKDYKELRLTYTPNKSSEKVNYSVSIVAPNGGIKYDTTGELYGDCTIEQIDKKSVQEKIAFLFRNTGK